jgi:hypothetical protein
MNQTFQGRRWVLLVREHWASNGKKYLLSLLALAGIMTGFYSFFILAGHNAIPLNVQALSYFFGLFLTGCLSGSMLLDDLHHGPKSISVLLLPASHLEKLLCRLFFGILVFFIVYNVIFYLVDIPMVRLSNIAGRFWHDRNGETQPFKTSGIEFVFSDRQEMQPMPFPVGLNGYLFEAFFVAQSAFILGSVYFRKYSFIKTTISLFALFFFVFLFFGIFLSKTTPDHVWYNSMTSWRSDAAMADRYMVLPGWMDTLYYFLLGYPFALIFLTAAYFRIREKQV